MRARPSRERGTRYFTVNLSCLGVAGTPSHRARDSIFHSLLELFGGLYAFPPRECGSQYFTVNTLDCTRFERPQGTSSEAEGLSQLNFRMQADAGHGMSDTSAVPLLHCAIPWLCQWSLESVLRVVCSERGMCDIYVYRYVKRHLQLDTRSFHVIP